MSGAALAAVASRHKPARCPARLALVAWWLGSLALLFSSIAPAWALAVPPAVIDPEVRRQVRQGPARVLVELRLFDGIQPQGDLAGSDAMAAQRAAIAAAQSRVLARLAGTHFSLLRHYESIPMLLLEIHGDALSRLEQMGDLVARVMPDRRKAPMAPESPR